MIFDAFRSRKDQTALAKLLEGSDVIQLHALLTAAEKYGLEGIVLSATTLPYRSGHCVHWQKVKTARWRTANADRGERFKCKIAAGLREEEPGPPLSSAVNWPRAYSWESKLE